MIVLFCEHSYAIIDLYEDKGSSIMGKVIIELTDSVEVKITARNLADAIEKLVAMKNNEAIERFSNLTRYRGIARDKDTVSEEEWYGQ